MSSSLQSFLQQNPQLLRPPTELEHEAQLRDVVVWEERPDHLCCYCCGGDGLVRTEVMRRYVNPDYDPNISQPVRCDRSNDCGYERQRVNDPEHGDRLLEFHRYANRTELPTLPRDLADRIHREMKAEAKAAALAGNRVERIAFARKSIRALGGAFTMPEADS